tara:strand:- start:1135 stop:1515 length:381 start_codon:yes stop_codon:yes gene_type:complete
LKQINIEDGLTPEQRKTLKKLIDVLEQFRTLDPDMPTQTLLSFLYCKVLENEEDFATVRMVAEKLRTSSSSASRNILAHTEHNRQLKGGTMLVETFENPLKRNEKVVRYTPKGERMLASILSRLSD